VWKRDGVLVGGYQGRAGDEDRGKNERVLKKEGPPTFRCLRRLKASLPDCKVGDKEKNPLPVGRGPVFCLRCFLTSSLSGIRLLSNRYRLLAANKSEENNNNEDKQADAEDH
jgi:hypothetical protein